MSSPIIAGFIFDAQNDDKFAGHGLSSMQVFQVLENETVVIPNRRLDIHAGSYLVIGRDNGGAPIAVPIEPTHELDVWRPVTAWLATGWELAELTKRGI